MSRRIMKLFALMFVVVLALSGCNLIRVDEEKDNAQIVATFNGGTLTKGELMPDYEYAQYYYSYMSAIYGYTISTDGLLEDVAEELVTNKILLAKAAEQGLDALDEDKLAQIDASAAEAYEETVESYWETYAEDGLTDEEIRASVEEYLASNDYTLESVKGKLQDEAVMAALQDSIYASVAVTPGDLQDRYDEMVSSDEASYSNTTTFETAVTNGYDTIAWYPEGYRTVKQIMLAFTDDQSTELSAKNTEIATVQAQLEDLEGGEAASDEEGAEAPTVEELTAQVETLRAEKQALLDGYVMGMQDKIDEINARIEAGEDFDTLMAEYGEDSGMQKEPGMTEGYYVCADSTSWVQVFTDTAMSLKKVGDISEPVVSNYGVHIIRYNSDVTPGAVAFDTLKEGIEEDLLAEKQTEAYSTQVATWLEEANVKYNFSCIEK